MECTESIKTRSTYVVGAISEYVLLGERKTDDAVIYMNENY